MAATNLYGFDKTCTTDAECPDKMGCCIMVDPGTVSADSLKAAGFPRTKSKICAN